MRTRALLILLACLLIPVLAQAQEGVLAAITFPADGQTVSGVITITGSADDPTFVGYQLWFALAGTEQWFAITGPIQQPVRDGNLAQWDTAQLPPGQYRLRLQVFRADASVTEDIVEAIQINQAQPADTSTGNPSGVESAPPTDIPVLENSPALPSESIPVVENIPVESGQIGDRENAGNLPDLGNAFCTGALIGVGLFLVMGVYVAARDRLTRLTKQ